MYSDSAQATLFVQIFSPKTILSHIHQQNHSCQPLNPIQNLPTFFPICWVKPKASCIWMTPGPSHNLPRLSFSTTLYSQLSNQSDRVAGQQTLPLLLCTLPSPRAACVCSVSSTLTSAPVLQPVVSWLLFRQVSASGPLHLLCPLPGTRFPGSPMAPSYPSVRPFQTIHPLVPSSGMSGSPCPALFFFFMHY